MSSLDFIPLFAQAAREVSGTVVNGFDRDTVISDLDLDSVAVVELVAYLEEQLGIRVPDDELARVKTVGDLEAVVRELAVNVRRS